VMLCRDRHELQLALEQIEWRPWFARHGALVQELVPPAGHDLRIVVAGGRAVGAARRTAAPGEWRTNVALGGLRRPVSDPPRAACELALAAARAAGAALVGVDLVPDASGSWTIIELNGAVEFTSEYKNDGDVFECIASELARSADRVLATEFLELEGAAGLPAGWRHDVDGHAERRELVRDEVAERLDDAPVTEDA
jgi:glutathione synthase/RimK-type ligase-like ATP-grasp enzyme